MKRFLALAGVLAIAPTYANNNTQTNDLAGDICHVVTANVYNMAVEHQAGVSKQKVQKQLDKDIATLSKRFSDKNFVGFVDNSWKKALNIIYTLPVQDTKEGKEEAVSHVVERALNACLDDMGVQ